jgi:hypothetical protein
VRFFRSWNKPLTGPPDFRKFATIDLDRSGNFVNEHAGNATSDNVKLQALYNDINPAPVGIGRDGSKGRTRGNLSSDLKKLYSANGRWASLLAALSIDEDWVETFELIILEHSNPPLTSLQLVINGTKGGDGNIPSDDTRHKKVQLYPKEQCLSLLANLPWPPQPAATR